MNPTPKKESESAEAWNSTVFNDDLDPDNATSPLDFEDRQRVGERFFYPEGDPEGKDSDEG